MKSAVFIASALMLACGSAPPPKPAPPPAPSAKAPAARGFTILGSNDLHGHIETLPLLAGYVERVRQKHPVLLVDAGDAFQGTLESNLDEGATVVRAYDAMGYAAAAIGNHEFDYGPVGSEPAVTSGNRFGALSARIAESEFPWLSANLVEAASKRPPRWQNLRSHVLVDVGGVRVGLTGVLTAETPKIVMPAFFEGLAVEPLAETLAREARALRAAGADVVVALAHAGGECTDLEHPKDLSSCDESGEIMSVARALPAGAVDVIVAGHTHKGMAQRIGGTAVVEAFAYGQAFSRVDVTLPEPGKVALSLHPPERLCSEPEGSNVCTPHAYEGAPVAPVRAIQRVVQPAIDRARRQKNQELDTRVVGTLKRSFDQESVLGNLFADLLLQSVPRADAAILNGGGLRADIAPGELTYGAVYEAMPFDNHVATLRLSGAELKQVLSRHLVSGAHGIVSVAGIRVLARCSQDGLKLELLRVGGRPIRDDERLTVATSDYLSSGGDGLFDGVRTADRVHVLESSLLRDAFVARLRGAGEIRALDPRLFDPKRPRLSLPTPRPVTCP